MQPHPAILTLVLAAATVSSQAVHLTQQNDARCAFPGAKDCQTPISDYLSHVCLPQAQNSTSKDPNYDYNAPCNALVVIEAQCIYGNDGLKAASTLFGKTAGPGRKRQIYDLPKPRMELSNSTQRQCLCESQFFDALRGCQACFTKHGADSLVVANAGPGDGGLDPSLDDQQINAVSQAYCAVSATPTANLANELFDAYNSVVPSESKFLHTTISAFSLSDPIGNKTEVSLYFTPKVTGSSFWSPNIPTGSPTTSNGQIVATGATGPGSSSGGTSPSPSPTKPSGASSLTVVSGGVWIALAAVLAIL